MDVIEDPEYIAVITDLPGVNKEDIKIDLTEGTLEITARVQRRTRRKKLHKKREKVWEGE